MKVKSVISILILVSCSAMAQNEEQLFHYLKVSSANAEVSCYLNGFPVYDIDSEGMISNQTPVNLALVGENNVLKIVAKPLGDNAFVSGGISTYGGGEMVSTDDNREGQLQFEFKMEEPTIKTYEFDNERFDYSASIQSVPVLNDEEALKDYALKIHSLIKLKKSKRLIEEMTPKLEDTAKAFSVDANIMYENMKQVLQSNIFATPWQGVSREEIVPVSYCDGKVWELTQKDGKPLIYYQESEDSYSSMKIFVAKVDGKLRVVR
ncbi:MAG: hypothetical protein ABJH05_10040 [Fulvivirga sp.]